MADEIPTGDKAIFAFFEMVALAFAFEGTSALLNGRLWIFVGSLAAAIFFFVVGIRWPRIKGAFVSYRFRNGRWLLVGGVSVGVIGFSVFAGYLFYGYLHGLTGTLDRISTLDANTVYIVASVRNSGRPTLAEDYTLSVNFNTGMKREGVRMNTPETRNIIHQDGKLERLHKSDALDEKTSLSPIPTGVRMRGTLIFTIPDVVLEAYQPGTSFTLGFSDEWGKKYTVVDKWDGSAPHDIPLPGFKPDITPFPIHPPLTARV